MMCASVSSSLSGHVLYIRPLSVVLTSIHLETIVTTQCLLFGQES